MSLKKNIFGNSGLALVSDRIIDYLDYDGLVNAAKTCKTWHDEIMSRDSLWKKCFDRACSEWRHYYLRREEEGDRRGYCSEWTDENLEIFKKTGSSEDLCLLIELIKKLMEHCCDEFDNRPSDKLRFHYDPPAPRLLQLAAEFGLCKLAKNLIEKGAQVNHPGDLHRIGTPLHLAIENGKFETVKLLIEKGAEIGAACGYDKITPLHVASQNREIEIAKLLIEKGALLEARTIDHETPLHIACKSGKLEIVKLLTEKGAQLELKNRYSKTPLDVAFICSQEEICKFLIDNGAINEGHSCYVAQMLCQKE